MLRSVREGGEVSCETYKNMNYGNAGYYMSLTQEKHKEIERYIGEIETRDR